MTAIVDFVKRLSIVFVLTFVIGLLFFSVKLIVEEERFVHVKQGIGNHSVLEKSIEIVQM
ncbi:hypothetical protein ACE1TH_05260 [Shouchella sp. JSM 1781072]|uniref:hypothetical protein n=1 Tax=Bacillaceae TaxID=186817 RepID=UPI000C076BC7|nr:MULTISPECIES: hypothetical protein [Bacillaceae]UTR04596.1 hypothetical protein MM326_10595 [Alkalihalobacillus sp. LMS6]